MRLVFEWKDLYICKNCGYNTKEFHHRSCDRCGSEVVFKQIKMRTTIHYIGFSDLDPTGHTFHFRFPFKKKLEIVCVRN